MARLSCWRTGRRSGEVVGLREPACVKGPLMNAHRWMITAAALCMAVSLSPAAAQRACPHPESDRDNITRTLQSAASCQRAYDMMNACRSNTGGDVELAEIVIQRCEGSFLAGLSPASRRTYDEERAACRRRYAKREGTMYVSFAVTCEAGVAARFAGAAEQRSRGK